MNKCCRYIKTDAHKMEVAVKPPMAVTNAVSWRTEGIRHKKNEVGADRREKNGAMSGIQHLSGIKRAALYPASGNTYA